jgi:hypothetical protein
MENRRGRGEGGESDREDTTIVVVGVALGAEQVETNRT